MAWPICRPLNGTAQDVLGPWNALKNLELGHIDHIAGFAHAVVSCPSDCWWHCFNDISSYFSLVFGCLGRSWRFTIYIFFRVCWSVWVWNFGILSPVYRNIQFLDTHIRQFDELQEVNSRQINRRDLTCKSVGVWIPIHWKLLNA
jgi:hypothetical protein